jgi:U3 small nucleolar ribonucleoprotein component
MAEQTGETTAFETAIDVVEALPPEYQETLIELIHHRLAERRRDEIARHTAETLEAVRQGRAQYGTCEDLERDLLADEASGDVMTRTGA